MIVHHISPQQAKQLLERGALLVDIREADEHARERISGAKHFALSSLSADAAPLTSERVVIFHCRSGNRTHVHAARLRAHTGAEAYALAGGLEAWKQAGLPVVRDTRAPLELMRQVQIAAGTLVLMGVLLGALVHPALYALAAFVGAGLVFAGVSGVCALARALASMPWNRRLAREQASAS